MSTTPSLRNRVKRLEASLIPATDRAEQMRRARERRAAMSPVELVASDRGRIERCIAALNEPDARPGTDECAVQGMRRRFARRYLDRA